MNIWVVWDGLESGTFFSWFKTQREQLKQGGVQSVLRELERLVEVTHTQGRPEVATLVQAKREGLGQRQAQICYAEFMAAGYLVSSGAMESANKLVVEARLKGGGMRWADNPLLALGNLVCNDPWEEGKVGSKAASGNCARLKKKTEATVNNPQIPEHWEEPLLPDPNPL